MLTLWSQIVIEIKGKALKIDLKNIKARTKEIPPGLF